MLNAVLSNQPAKFPRDADKESAFLKVCTTTLTKNCSPEETIVARDVIRCLAQNGGFKETKTPAEMERVQSACKDLEARAKTISKVCSDSFNSFDENGNGTPDKEEAPELFPIGE